MRHLIKSLLPGCVLLLVCALLLTGCQLPGKQKDERFPVKMTAVYIPDADNIYGAIISDWDFEAYLQWSDGTVEKTKKFALVDENRDLAPANSVKTFTLKSTEYDLTATVDIAIPGYRAFPEDRGAFCEKFYDLMQNAGITEYTMDYKKDNNGIITGVTFKKPLNGYWSYWYDLDFTTFPHDPNASHFDRVKLDANGAIYDEDEMEQMKLLLITLTLPAQTHSADEAYALIRKNDGKLTAGNVEYLAFFTPNSTIVHGAMYYLSADIVQDPCSEVDPQPIPTAPTGTLPAPSVGSTEPAPLKGTDPMFLLLVAAAAFSVIVIVVADIAIAVKKKKSKKRKEQTPPADIPALPAQPAPVKAAAKCSACGRTDVPLETIQITVAGTPLSRTLCPRCAARFKPN